MTEEASSGRDDPKNQPSTSAFPSPLKANQQRPPDCNDTSIHLPLFNMESRMRMRRRPLEICGKSILATANRAYTKARDSPVLSGAFTKLLKKSMCIVRLLFCTIQYHCLVVISAMDNWILSAETAVERIFPPSAYVFNTVDDLVKISESFPERWDGVLTRIISWLEISVSAMSRWESKSASEKEIGVDTGHGEKLKIPDHSKGDADVVDLQSKGTTEEEDAGEDQTRNEETCKKRKEVGGGGKNKRGKKKD